MRPRGLFLVTGPTGSGKSTSLASMINYINETVDHHIITIEDPIEFYHPNKKSTVNQREVGVDVPSFSEALRRALRQDPGRDPGGRNARPGHDRSGHHRGRDGARRVRHAAHQRRPGHGQPHHRRVSQHASRSKSAPSFRRRSSACMSQAPDAQESAAAACAAYEMLVVTPAIGNLIRENKTFRITSAIQTGAKHGHDLAGRCAVQLVAGGQGRQRPTCWPRLNRPTNWPSASPMPSAACSTTTTTSAIG